MSRIRPAVFRHATPQGMSLSEVLISLFLVLFVLAMMLTLFSWWRRTRQRMDAVRAFLAAYRASLYWVERDSLEYRQAWSNDPAWSTLPPWFDRGFTHPHAGVSWVVPRRDPPAVLASTAAPLSSMRLLGMDGADAAWKNARYVWTIDGSQGHMFLLQGRPTRGGLWIPNRVVFRLHRSERGITSGARVWPVDVVEYLLEPVGDTGMRRLVRRRNGEPMVLMERLFGCKEEGLRPEATAGQGWPRFVCRFREPRVGPRTLVWSFVLMPQL